MGLSGSHRNKIQNTKHMQMFNEQNCFWNFKKNIKHLQVLVSSKLERLKIHGILNSKLKWENSQKGYLF
jgi:hypothetical protein